MKRSLILVLVVLMMASVCWALNCPKCGKGIADGAKFCGSCGLNVGSVRAKCPKCKNSLKFPDKFCGKCGTKINWPKQTPGPGPGPGPKPPVPTPPDSGELRGASMDSGDIFAQASPAVLRIEVKNKAGQKVSSGSGFFISADGFIVTNFHVIDEAWSATAVTKDNKKYSVLGYAAVDPAHDLAVIRVSGKDLPHLNIAPPKLPRVGAKVVAIGFPLGRPTCTLSEGIVSGHTEMALPGSEKQKFIQTTAAISHGSSGGPLLSGYGKILVQGVTSGTIGGGQSLNLAVPSSMVHAVLAKKSTIRRLPPPRPKLVIPEGPAPKAPVYQPKFTDPFDEAVKGGIKKGVEYLWSKQQDDGSWKAAGVTMIGPAGRTQKLFPVGTTALMVYALLEAGESVQDKRMIRALRWLAREKTNKTYSIALRACAWRSASKFRDTKEADNYRKKLATDVRTLVKMTENGSYTYEGTCKDSAGDNSNAQYGLLGVWAGARAHMEGIPSKYWEVVARHWKNNQNPDGGWGYAGHHRQKSYPSMTVAGLASMYVCVDNLSAGEFAKCGRNARIPSIDKGMKYLADTIGKIKLDSLMEGQGGNVSRRPLDMYYLFGVERVALASGYKYFGNLNWYRDGAQRILGNQRAHGSGMIWAGGWGDGNVGTAYGLLFLSRGRGPVVFNKLEFPADWNNRPRDLASLTRWLSETFERTVNWQIVKLTNPVDDWHDAPVLYMSASKAPGLTDEHVKTLRTYVQQGGTIFSVTECNGTAFKTGMRKVYEKMFPEYKLLPLPPKHELFSIQFDVRAPNFHMISNGIRPLVIHCDYDLPLAWQQRRSRTQKWKFQVAANVAMYVTGKGAFKPRGITHWPTDKKITPDKTVKLAKIKHPGNCDPEPLAHERLRRLLAHRSKIKLEVVGPVAIADLAGSGAKVATLTGTGKLTLSADDQKALKAFVDGGGTLVIDAAGGDEEFDSSARAALTSMYGTKLRMLASSAALFKQKGMEVTKVRYRGQARQRLGGSRAVALRGVLVKDRVAVVYSREDLTGALVGYESATCSGYDPDSSFEIMRAIVNQAGS